jgi:hypothetical protein
LTIDAGVRPTRSPRHAGWRYQLMSPLVAGLAPCYDSCAVDENRRMPKLRCYIAPNQRYRLARLRRGAVLALLALVSQSVVALLPMPALADVPFEMAICGSRDGSTPGAPQPGKSKPHTVPACPMCHAAQLAATLLPPTSAAIILRRVATAWPPVASITPSPVDHSFRPQKARAPPLSV